MLLSSHIAEAITAINAFASITIAFAWFRSIFVLVRRKGIEQSRLVLARGLISALSLLTAGTLLKTVELRSWESIVAFVMVFGMRTLMKTVLQWDIRRLLEEGEPRLLADSA